MNYTEKHTFVILVYKESPYLEECICSLKNQSAKSRILITTSTPSDFLTAIAGKYDIPIFVNWAGGGIAADWTFGYAQCQTDYLTLAHQDDIYLPRYTELCMKEAQRHAQSRELIIFTGYQDFVGDKVRNFALHRFIKDILLLPFLFKQDIKSRFFKRLIVSFGTPIPCPSVIYHKAEIGDFEFAHDMNCNMDWDAWLRLSSRRGSFIYVKKQLFLHRINSDSQTLRQIRANIRQMEDLRVFQRLWPSPVAVCLARIYSLAVKFYITN